MRRLLPLNATPFIPTIEHGDGGTVAYFGAVMHEQIHPRGKAATLPEPAVVDLSDPDTASWFARVKVHYAAKGFTVMDPDDDGNVEIRFYTTGAPEAVE